MSRHLIAAALVISCALVAGCTSATDRVLVRPQVVEVPRYVRTPIPAELTAPIVVPWPDGRCWLDTARVLCNGQLAALLLDYREALERANADRAALRAADAEANP
jgi:hypothetical protein